eukprot:m.11907 g.11907  ORF g.11907 m.11907 type:complete len:428 (+) comp9045_c0_seq1:281-1564(+)
MHRAVLATVAIGVTLLRLALVGLGPEVSSISQLLARRPEIVTPLTSPVHSTECIALINQGQSPYSGSICHEPPVALYFHSLFDSHRHVKALLYVLLDVGSALLLSSMFVSELTLRQAKEADALKRLESTNHQQWVRLRDAPILSKWLHTSDWPLIATLWLANPLNIMVSVAQSVSVAHNFLCILSVWCMMNHRVAAGAIVVACATHVGVYPVVLVFPLIAQANNKVTALVVFVVSLGALVLFSFSFEENWKWVFPTLGTVTYVADLTPNIGLCWYLLTEMFDHFRDYFIALLHISTVLMVMSVSLKFWREPLFLATMLVGIISVVKTYPSVADFALFLGLVSVRQHLGPYIKFSLLISGCLLACTILFPMFWYTWMGDAGGNANFYYAITLVYAFAQSLFLNGLFRAHLTHEHVLLHGLPNSHMKLT